MDVKAHNLCQAQLRLLSDLWKIPIVRQYISKNNKNYKSNETVELDHCPKIYDHHSFDGIKGFVEDLQGSIRQHRTKSLPRLAPTFKERMAKQSLDGIAKSMKPFHKDIRASIVWINHKRDPELQVIEHGRMQFRVPRSWFKHCLNITKTHLSDTGIMLARAKPVGKTSDGHPMFSVKAYKATYKPKSVGLELVLLDETFLTHDADGTDFALGINFMQARDKLRKQMAKSMTAKMKVW